MLTPITHEIKVMNRFLFQAITFHLTQTAGSLISYLYKVVYNIGGGEDMKSRPVAKANSAAHLLQVANYLSRPQQFMAVAEARAGLRQALEDASQCSIVLTNNGQPQAAIVPFQTLEAMRSALLQMLVGGMQASFERVQKELAAQFAQPGNGQGLSEATSEEELESLVKDARRRSAKANSAKRRKKSR